MEIRPEFGSMFKSHQKVLDVSRLRCRRPCSRLAGDEFMFKLSQMSLDNVRYALHSAFSN